MNIEQGNIIKRVNAAKIISFLGLLCLFTNFSIAPTLFSKFPVEFFMTISQIALFSLLGVFLGFFICPFFLPNPVKGKPLRVSIIFIVLLVLPNVILRFLGVDFYIHSYPVRAVVSLLSGILAPTLHGLFFMSHLLPENRMCRNCILHFCLVFCGAYFVRFITLPLLELSGITAVPQRFMSFLYNSITWLMIGTGISAIVCLVLLSGIKMSAKSIKEKYKNLRQKTDWSVILRLIGIAVIYRILNAIAETRLTPVLNLKTEGILEINLLVTILALAAIGFLSRFISINRLIKLFLLFSVSLFILLPCLFFLGDHPGFVLLVNVLLTLFSYLVWVLFATALVVAYVPSRSVKYRGFLFYGITTVIYFTTVFQFIVIRLNRFIPPASVEFIILISSIFAIALFFLSFKIFHPARQPEPQAMSPQVLQETEEAAISLSAEEKFHEYRLTKREIDIANVLLKEGWLDVDEIGERLCISANTVKTHITSIYRKFKVNKRSEFMALFLD